MKVDTVTVIGANGTMGKLVGGLIAAFGNAKVFMVCRDKQQAEKAVIGAAESVKAYSIKNRLIPKDYDDIQECLQVSDWVFESVAENYEIKKSINQMINQYVKTNAVISTGTSGLSVEKLSDSLEESLKKRYIGTHFFNPPYNLNLCEVIPTSYTDKIFLKEFKNYLKSILFRSIVEVKDSAGFLGNRIGFQFMNTNLQSAEKYQDKGGIDYIDTLLGQFTGRSMAPLVTVDFVGLDIHKAIVDNIFQNTSDYAKDTFRLPVFMTELIEGGKLGRKTGAGLYKRITLANGKKENWVYDIASKIYRPVNKYDLSFIKEIIGELRIGNYQEAIKRLIEDKSQEADIIVTHLLEYIIYALVASNEVGQGAMDADTVMTMGFNWAPPLAVIEVLGGSRQTKKICFDRLGRNTLSQVDIEKLFDNIPSSEYDYRRYFRAKQ